MSVLGRPRARPCADDDGFTMAELMVTIMVIGAVLLGLVAMQTMALITTTQAKQRQQATAVGNQVMEQLRSLPFDALAKGMNPAVLGSDPNVTSGRFAPAANTAIDEVPLAGGTGVTTRAPLAGTGGSNLTSVVDSATSSVTFLARAYTTRAPAAAVDSPIWLSVVVTWSSSVTSGQLRTEIFRSRAFAPKGCLSTATRPFSGPCQAFLYGDAAANPPLVTVAGAAADVPVLEGAPATAISLSLAEASGGIASEQTNSVHGRVASSGTEVTEEGSLLAAHGSQEATTLAGDDISSGAAPLTSSMSVDQSSSSLAVDGTFATITATPSSGDVGASTSTARAGGTDCRDLSGAAMSEQPCSNSTVAQEGTATVAVDVKSVDGRNLPSFQVARIDEPTAGSTAWVGRYVTTAGAARCVVVSGAGCVSAGASRAVGSAAAGALPEGTAVDTVTDLTHGMVSVSNYADQAVAESGADAIGASPVFARSGTVRYWTAGGYVDQVLSASTALSVPLHPALGTYLTASGLSLTVAVTGSLTIRPSSTSSTTPDVECVSACTTEATMPSVVTQLHYDISNGGVILAAFDVTADLGSSVAATSYKAAPGG